MPQWQDLALKCFLIFCSQRKKVLLLLAYLCRLHCEVAALPVAAKTKAGLGELELARSEHQHQADSCHAYDAQGGKYGRHTAKGLPQASGPGEVLKRKINRYCRGQYRTALRLSVQSLHKVCEQIISPS
jgi:hypothetical protein